MTLDAEPPSYMGLFSCGSKREEFAQVLKDADVKKTRTSPRRLESLRDLELADRSSSALPESDWLAKAAKDAKKGLLAFLGVLCVFARDGLAVFWVTRTPAGGKLAFRFFGSSHLIDFIHQIGFAL